MSSPRSRYIVIRLFAEDEGFKPPIPKSGIPDFESSAFDHSANLPFSGDKDNNNIYIVQNIFHDLFFCCLHNRLENQEEKSRGYPYA